MKTSTVATASCREKPAGSKLDYNNNEIGWELRPCGLLVQKRGGLESSVAGNQSSGGPMINIKVSHDSCYHDVTVPAHSTFGDLKSILQQITGLEPKDQRLLFRGKEKEEDEYLHIAGMADMSKLILLEDPASKDRKMKETMNQKDDKATSLDAAYEAIGKVKQDVDKLSQKVLEIETALHEGVEVADKEFVVLTELLMMQLLKLDGIDADSESKMQRRAQVHRVQSYVEKLDNLKARNSKPTTINDENAPPVTIKWETFDSGVGSLRAPVPILNSTRIVEDWERFD